MKILKSWLQKHIVETLPNDDEIVNAFTLKSSEIEGIEKVRVNGKEDTVFDIKVLPDRMHYMLSHRGVAYDLCAILNLTLKPIELLIPEKGDDVKVNIESILCRRNTATLIKNIDNNIATPLWLKESLEALGSRSISLIVDITNYSMLDTGQPLHAFDNDAIKGDIYIRFAKEGEMVETLDKKNIKLNKNNLVIADNNGPLDIAGIKGGKRAEVTPKTKDIILFASNFDPVSIRRTSFDVGIRNDASKRFENEITPHLVINGVSSFIKILKGESISAQIMKMSDKYKTLPETWSVSVSHKDIESYLNFSIKENRVKEILEKLLCKVEIKSGNYKVTPPFERLDLIIKEDIIDEIGRIEGLDKVKSVLPKGDKRHDFSNSFLITEKIKDIFESKGFSEIQTRTFTNKGDIEVAYPMASDKAFLRTSLLENVSESMKLAINNAPLLGIDKIQIFEIGKVFPKNGERLDLCFGIQYTKKIKNKDQIIKDEINSIIKDLEDTLKIKINPEITSNFVSIKDLEKISTKLEYNSLKSNINSNTIFKPFSNEPFIVRDIALFVDSSEKPEDVQKIIKQSIDIIAKELLIKGPDLFDQFEKDGKKSLAFRMLFQANDRTLTDEEVNGFMDKVYEKVKEKGWQVR